MPDLMDWGRRRLLLLRHAQAADAPGLVDIERPLVERGEQDAVAAGRWLRLSDVSPDLVLCSTARRARRTWDLVVGELPTAPPVSYDERVYQADEPALFSLVRETDDSVRALLVVGHNPSVHQLAIDLAGAGTLQEGFPAAALALLDVVGPWAELALDAAELAAFVPPGHND